MNNTITYTQVANLAAREWAARKCRPKDERLYVRWSTGVEYNLPATDQNSTDHSTGQQHYGLSAIPLVTIIESDLDGQTIWWPLDDSLIETIKLTISEYRYLMPGQCYIISGQQVGVDTDNAPTIQATKIHGYIPRQKILATCSPVSRRWIA